MVTFEDDFPPSDTNSPNYYIDELNFEVLAPTNINSS